MAGEAAATSLFPSAPTTLGSLRGLTDTVVVKSSSELINTTTATVAATLNADQITRMPTPSDTPCVALLTISSSIEIAEVERYSKYKSAYSPPADIASFRYC